MKFPRVIRQIIQIGLIGLVASLAGCNYNLNALPLPGLQAPSKPTPTSAQSSTLISTGLPTPDVTASPASATGTAEKLRIWLPPQFDPDGEGSASALLKDRLNAFIALHPGLELDIRLKSASGAGGLLDSLTATSAAAPGALPDLVAFSRSDLEAATLKGLLFPYDGKVNLSDDPDWFTFARQLALLQGTTFGIPFAGDALILAYRPIQVGISPEDWNGLFQLRPNNVVSFPADDADGLFALTLYLSTGAPVEDSQHRPILNVDALASVLGVIDSGAKDGAFPYWLSQYNADSQSWQAFEDKRANWAVTWVSRYLGVMPADGAMLSLIPMSKAPFTLADGWDWALASPTASQRRLAQELAQFLADGNFLSRWTSAAGYLPTRPSALAGWSNQSLQSMLNQVVISAQLRPSDEIMVSLGPVLQDATLQVLKGQSDPARAAQNAVDRLKGP